MERRCLDCGYWKDNEDGSGECRFNAPASYFGDEVARTRWPLTLADEWCGRFKPKGRGRRRTAKLTEIQRAIIACLQANQPMRVRDLARQIAVNAESTRTILHRLFRRGVIHRVGLLWACSSAEVQSGATP